MPDQAIAKRENIFETFSKYTFTFFITLVQPNLPKLSNSSKYILYKYTLFYKQPFYKQRQAEIGKISSKW